METKYGYIAITDENGVKKWDFMNSKFKSTNSMLAFLGDTELMKQIFGY